MTEMTSVLEQARIDVRAKLDKDPSYDPKDKFIPVRRDSLCDPECDVCGGTGYYRHDLDNWHAQFGTIYPCPNRDLIQGIDTQSKYGLDQAEIETLGWDSLIDEGDAIAASEIVKETLHRGYGWVYLWGGHGKAKSLILKIVVAELLREGKRAGYSNMPAILDHLRQAFDTDYPSQESIRRLKFWSDIPVLCIDEFDRINNTAWVAERTFSLMDKRYESALQEQSITLIASNKPPQDLGEGYLIDRIQDGRFSVFELTGESMRPGMEN